MIKIIAMRHGEAKHNLEDKLSSSDSLVWGLTRKGIEEVERSSVKLQKENIDFIISSPIPRAMQTAQIVAHEIGFQVKDVQTDERLKEPSFGDMEGKTYTDFYSLFKSHQEAFALGAPHGETGNEVFNRISECLDELASNPNYDDKTVLLVTHGFVICHISKYFLGKFEEIPPYAEYMIFNLKQHGERMKEFCFGIIPLRRKENGWEVLLVKHNKGHWGFPKGHPCREETPEQIACREVYEETGLSVMRFFQTHPLIEEYTIREEEKSIDKTVTYFLAEVKGEMNLLEKEVCESRWLSLDDAMELLTFDEAKKICLDAKNILSSLPVS